MEKLDELKEKCIQAMKDVDTFVDEHYEELCNEIREQRNIPEGWIVKIVSNCGVVHGCFRQSEKDEWTRVVYNDGEWLPLYDL